MTNKGFLSHRCDTKHDVNNFDGLIKELKSIKKDKQIITEMELSDKVKELCFKDLDKQLTDIKERMHNAIDEM